MNKIYFGSKGFINPYNTSGWKVREGTKQRKNLEMGTKTETMDESTSSPVQPSSLYYTTTSSTVACSQLAGPVINQ